MNPATPKPTHYFGHDAVTDQYEVIAPWYHQQNGPCDCCIRITAETLKRYPLTTTQNAVTTALNYLLTSNNARNILTLFFNHNSTDPKSGGDVFNGAWAYPESGICCGRPYSMHL